MRVRLYVLVNDWRCHWSFHFILNCKHAVQCDVLFDNTTESRLLGLVESTKEHAWVLIDGTFAKFAKRWLSLLERNRWYLSQCWLELFTTGVFLLCPAAVCAFRCKFSFKNCALKTSVLSCFVESLFIHIEGWPLLLMTCHWRTSYPSPLTLLL